MFAKLKSDCQGWTILKEKETIERGKGMEKYPGTSVTYKIIECPQTSLHLGNAQIMRKLEDYQSNAGL